LPADDDTLTPHTLLRRAAAADAARAVELLGRLSTTRLLDLVVTQAELAVDEEGAPRAAGIDAVGDLERAAVEVMDLPQDTDLDLDDDPTCPPTVTGWDLVTVAPDELVAATLAVPVAPWLLALVAFADEDRTDGRIQRRVVAAAADGRVAAATLRWSEADDDDADILTASVSREPEDLGSDAVLARALRAALLAAARGG
jgi:hypothetical protein